MGGVDLVDQQLDQVNVLRRTYKWYKKLALRLVMQGMLNSHKIYQLNGGKHDILKFMHDVVAVLISHTPRLNRCLPTDDTIQRLGGRLHVPGKRRMNDSNADKMANKSKRCRVCIAQKRTFGLKTVYVCLDCPSQPGLHFECFRTYHTKLDYSCNNIQKPES